MREGDWRDEYRALKQLSSSISPQRRGIVFEETLRAMLDDAGAHPRGSYRTGSEQLDGSSALLGYIYLMEAKWTKSPVGASSLYAFQGKVDRKFIGTIGLFFSMQGYTRGALDGLVRRGSLNIILFDGSDLDAIADGAINFRDLLSIKQRLASEEGTPFVPVNSQAVKHYLANQERAGVIHMESIGGARLVRIPRCESCAADSFAKMYSHVEKSTGRRYRIDDLTVPGSERKQLLYEWHGTRPQAGRRWRYTRERMDRLLSEGRIHFRRAGVPAYKRYLDERAKFR